MELTDAYSDYMMKKNAVWRELAMRIDALDVYYVAHPLVEPWTTAYGSDPVIYSVMVKLTSGGETSWSESCPFLAPTSSPECAYGA